LAALTGGRDAGKPGRTRACRVSPAGHTYPGPPRRRRILAIRRSPRTADGGVRRTGRDAEVLYADLSRRTPGAGAQALHAAMGRLIAPRETAGTVDGLHGRQALDARACAGCVAVQT